LEVTQIRIVREDLINKAREQAFLMMPICMTRRSIQIVCLLAELNLKKILLLRELKIKTFQTKYLQKNSSRNLSMDKTIDHKA
jgi:hypothetical protein